MGDIIPFFLHSSPVDIEISGILVNFKLKNLLQKI